MVIGIDASRAFLKNRTGIEEYAYRVIEHLRDELPPDAEVILYVRQVTSDKRQEIPFKSQNEKANPKPSFCHSSRRDGNPGFLSCHSREGGNPGLAEVDPRLRGDDRGECGDDRMGHGDDRKSCYKNDEKRRYEIRDTRYKIQEIPWRRFWTQGGLAWEMFRRPVDVLLVPAHTVPWIHPKRTVVVVHGLEYEFCPGAYSLWERWYMRATIWLSCRWAWRIVAVSENTKRDLIRLYGAPEEKIGVIYEGVSLEMKNGKLKMNNGDFSDSKFQIPNSKFLLFIGRIEERKNVVRIVEAFEMLKEKYQISHMLVLAGKDGYGSDNAKCKIQNSKWRKEIFLTGYISEEGKAELLRSADVFVFPSLYEGFGLPILEAQSVGVPVVTSNVSSMPEVVQLDQRPTTNNQQPAKHNQRPTTNDQQLTTNDLPPTTYHLSPAFAAMLVDPYDVESIAEGIYSILLDNKKRERLISLGRENVKRFSWEKCAKQISNILTHDSQPTTNNNQGK